MKRSLLATGVWIGALGLLLCVASGCRDMDPAPDSRMGRLAMSLVGGSASGTQYRLSDAVFEISGVVERTIATDADPDAESIQLDLPVGHYQILLKDGWSLERKTAGGYASVSAALISDDPMRFEVVARNTTNVHFRFETAGQVIALPSGRLSVDIEVIESEDAGTETEPGLVLYSTLDSEVEATTPAVGPPGTLTGGSFVPGKRGQAYQTSIGSQLSFPTSVVPRDRGSVEFWARLTGYAAQESIPWGATPAFFAVDSPDSPPYTGYAIQLNGNDGFGGGGLAAWAGDGNTATHCYDDSPTYEAAIGDVAAWHHYAVSWDADGVPGSHYNVQLFLDGQLRGSPVICERENHDPHSFPVPVTGRLFLGYYQNPAGSLTIDEFKIWNYAKTDFASVIEHAP